LAADFQLEIYRLFSSGGQPTTEVIRVCTDSIASAESLNVALLRQFVVPCAGLSCVSQVTWSHQTVATKAEIIASQRLFRSSFTSYLLHGVLSSPAQLNDSEEDETSHADPHSSLLSRLGYDSTPLFTTVSNSVEGVIKLVFLRSKLNKVKGLAATALESMLQAMVDPNEVESLFTDPPRGQRLAAQSEKHAADKEAALHGSWSRYRAPPAAAELPSRTPRSAQKGYLQQKRCKLVFQLEETHLHANDACQGSTHSATEHSFTLARPSGAIQVQATARPRRRQRRKSKGGPATTTSDLAVAFAVSTTASPSTSVAANTTRSTISSFLTAATDAPASNTSASTEAYPALPLTENTQQKVGAQSNTALPGTPSPMALSSLTDSNNTRWLYKTTNSRRRTPRYPHNCSARNGLSRHCRSQQLLLLQASNSLAPPGKRDRGHLPRSANCSVAVINSGPIRHTNPYAALQDTEESDVNLSFELSGLDDLPLHDELGYPSLLSVPRSPSGELGKPV